MPMPADIVKAAAATLMDHRGRKATLEALPGEQKPGALEDGYAIQAEVIELRAAEGGTAIGYKIGATNAGARTLLGLPDMFWGVLLSTMTTESPAAFAGDEMYIRVIEPEIALRFGKPLDGLKKTVTEQDVVDAVDAVLPAIEIVDTPFGAGWTKAGGASLIADDGAHGAWIMGAPVDGAKDLNLLDLAVTLTADGQGVREGKGGNVEGGPFAVTAWLVNELAKHGKSIAAGDYVTTGSTTAPYPAQPTEAIVADFGPLGAVTVDFT
jgi:2-keto-4-pentenoate hydratase